MRNYKNELIQMLNQYKPHDHNDAESLSKTLKFLEENENVFGNSNVLGHITASVWLLDSKCENVLLTHHKKLNKWLQLGGHTEGDESIREAAYREAVEESGLKNLEFLSQSIFDVDVHEIPARNDLPAHFHYDIRFILKQLDFEQISISNESNDLKWIAINDISNYTESPSITRMVELTQRYWV